MMSQRRNLWLAGLAVLVAGGWFELVSVNAQQAPQYVGQTERGFVLPNGWVLNPAGEQILLADLPLNIIPLADNRHVLAATSGYNTHELTLVDLASKTILDRQTVRQSWFGLAVSPDGGTVWWSGGGGDVIHAFQVEDRHLKRTSGPEPPSRRESREGPHHFRSGITLDPHRHVLYSLDVDAGTISVLDPTTLKSDHVRAGRHAAVRHRGGPQRQPALRLGLGGASDPRPRAGLIEESRQHRRGRTPQPDCRPSAGRPDLRRLRIERLRLRDRHPPRDRHRDDPHGPVPDGAGREHARRLGDRARRPTLFVANADNNCVAVIDIATAGRSQVKGFIPTGWYPTAVAVTPDGKSLLVGVGKGNQTRPNPIDRDKAKPAGNPADTYRSRAYPYIGTTLSGALSVVPVPDDKELARLTPIVYRNCPYSDKLLTDAPYPEKTAIPTRVGDPSPIKHVLYIIKENRTYDQVLGDLPRGNGDPSLVMFGREVTPNHHKLAEEFVLLDNLYCNGHVSADGHPWSTMAYNTDYIARNWALTYSSRAGIRDDDEGELSNAPSGYLWDACAAPA